MTEIWVAIIGLIGVVITVLVSSKATRNVLMNKLETDNAVIKNEIEHIKDNSREMKEDIKEHNHYAKLFGETVPVIQEQIKVINHRLDDLEAINK